MFGPDKVESPARNRKGPGCENTCFYVETQDLFQAEIRSIECLEDKCVWPLQNRALIRPKARPGSSGARLLGQGHFLTNALQNRRFATHSQIIHKY